MGETLELDVAIIGGGLAATLLGRQLRAAQPDAKVALFERAPERSYKVGESTVEIATNYLIRRQGLSTYLYENHLPKNGLRFFFDNEQKNAALSDMSELGTDYLPRIPSFQLDRLRLERDLLTMNRDEGNGVHIGHAVRELELGEGERHRFVAVSDQGNTPVSAKWLIDASGRAQVVSRKKGLTVPVESHQLTAAWGRFEGVTDIDSHGTEEWRRQFRYTSRFLSTNHFCYPGYWIWFIPLGKGVVSVGVVCERSRWRDEWQGEKGFLQFLREHRTPSELLAGAKLVDYLAYKQLAYGTKQFFSKDRWAVIGDAAAFVDPFYSPGSDFISVENDFVTDLIARDAAGEDRALWEDRLETYDAFVQHRFEATMLLYEDQYPFFGSFELMRPKLLFDISGYYNQWLRPYLVDDHLDVDKLKAMLANRETVLAIMKQYRKLFAKAHGALQDRGEYYRLNTGDSGSFGPLLPFADEMGRRVSQDVVDKHTAWIFSSTRSWCKSMVRNEAPRTCAELASEL